MSVKLGTLTIGRVESVKQRRDRHSNVGQSEIWIEVGPEVLRATHYQGVELEFDPETQFLKPPIWNTGVLLPRSGVYVRVCLGVSGVVEWWAHITKHYPYGWWNDNDTLQAESLYRLDHPYEVIGGRLQQLFIGGKEELVLYAQANGIDISNYRLLEWVDGHGFVQLNPPSL